ncbi:MAG: hypothetical protein AABX16_04875 [Nanoarchaeota archaeon]
MSGCVAFDPTQEEKLLHETTVGEVEIRIIKEIRAYDYDMYRTEIVDSDGKVKAAIISSDLDYGTNIQGNDGKKYHMKNDKGYYQLPIKSDTKKEAEVMTEK